MRSRITLAVVTAVMLAALSFGSVSAANSKSTFRNCPHEFVLSDAASWTTNGFLDFNNDGWVCVWYSPLPGPAVAGDYIVIDNTAH